MIAQLLFLFALFLLFWVLSGIGDHVHNWQFVKEERNKTTFVCECGLHKVIEAD